MMRQIAFNSLLISNVQLCLAHYCDIHGPTPLMVTEGVQVKCAQCPEKTELLSPAASSFAMAGAADRPRSGAAAQSPLTDAFRRMSVSGDQPPSSPAVARFASDDAAGDGNAQQQQQQQPRRDYQRTYDESYARRAGPCENCAMTMPQHLVSNGAGSGAGGPGGAKASPVLRTRKPHAVVYTQSPRRRLRGESPASSDTASSNGSASPDDSEGEEDDQHDTSDDHDMRRRGSQSSSSRRSATRDAPSRHTHDIVYTSTHEPTVPQTFSTVRASCLRTLSVETLPRHNYHAQQPYRHFASGTQSSYFPGAPLPSPQLPNYSSPPTSNGASPSSVGSTTSTASFASAAVATTGSAQTGGCGPSFITTHSAGSAASGGPIFFGDPDTGYTTAFIFRIPDLHARGHKRVYAFLALSKTRSERVAMLAFAHVAARFRELAAWIQRCAEAEAERAAAQLASESGGSGGGSPVQSYPHSAFIDREDSMLSGAAAAASRGSVLTGGSVGGGVTLGGFSRRMMTAGGDGSYAGVGPGGRQGKTNRARGLPEIVGLPDFFIRLHSKFVELLMELSVRMGTIQ